MTLHRRGETDQENAAENNTAGTAREDRAQEQSYRNEPQRERNVNNNYDMRDDEPLVTTSVNSGTMSAFIEEGKRVLEALGAKLSRNGTLTWSLVPASAGDTDSLLDAAVVVAKQNDTGDAFATTLIFVGNTVMPKQPIVLGRDNTVKFTTTAFDQYAMDGYQDTLTRLVNAAPGLSQSVVEHIGSFPITQDKPTEQKLGEILTSAINQVDFYIRSLTGTQAFRIEDLDLKGSDLLANVVFQQEDTMDKVSELPHRSDIAIDVTLAPRTDRRDINANVLSRRGSSKLATISGHVDLEYVGPKEERRSRGVLRSTRRREDDVIDTQIYGTNLIITGLEHRQIPEYMMFALAQIPALVQEHVILQGLRPSTFPGSLRSPEALTYELNEEFEKLPEQIDDKMWIDLASNVIREDKLFVTLQLPRSGLAAPVQRLIVDACDFSNPNRGQVAEILIQAADVITGGRFSNNFKGDITDIGAVVDIPVLLGTWIDEKGNQRDLREIGRFEILTHYGQKSQDTVEIWDQCLHDDRIDMQARLDQMEKIIADYTGGNYRVIDRGDNVELNTNWLYQLTDACNAAGMVVTADGITQDTSAYRRGYQGRYAASDYDGQTFRSSRGRGGYGFGSRY